MSSAENDLQALIDTLRYRPVATTAAQMRDAATIIENMREALGCLLPGLALDLRYCDDDDDKDALRCRVETVEKGLMGLKP